MNDRGAIVGAARVSDVYAEHLNLIKTHMHLNKLPPSCPSIACITVSFKSHTPPYMTIPSTPKILTTTCA